MVDFQNSRKPTIPVTIRVEMYSWCLGVHINHRKLEWSNEGTLDGRDRAAYTSCNDFGPSMYEQDAEVLSPHCGSQPLFFAVLCWGVSVKVRPFMRNHGREGSFSPKADRFIRSFCTSSHKTPLQCLNWLYSKLFLYILHIACMVVVMFLSVCIFFLFLVFDRFYLFVAIDLNSTAGIHQVSPVGIIRLIFFAVPLLPGNLMWQTPNNLFYHKQHI